MGKKAENIIRLIFISGMIGYGWLFLARPANIVGFESSLGLLLLAAFLAGAATVLVVLIRKLRSSGSEIMALSEPDPDYSSISTAGRALMFTGLVLLGLLLNYLSFPLFFGVDFIFGGLASILLLFLFPRWLALAGAALISSYTIVLWSHPYAMVIFLLEFVFLCIFNRNYLKDNLFILNTVYWLVIGIPLVIIFYTFPLGLTLDSVISIAVKQSLNGILNALIVQLIIFAVSIQYPGLMPFKLKKYSLFKILTAGFSIAILFFGIAGTIIYNSINLSNRLVSETQFLDLGSELINKRIAAYHTTVSEVAFELFWEIDHLSQEQEIGRFLDDRLFLMQQIFPGFLGIHYSSPYESYSSYIPGETADGVGNDYEKMLETVSPDSSTRYVNIRHNGQTRSFDVFSFFYETGGGGRTLTLFLNQSFELILENIADNKSFRFGIVDEKNHVITGNLPEGWLDRISIYKGISAFAELPGLNIVSPADSGLAKIIKWQRSWLVGSEPIPGYPGWRVYTGNSLQGLVDKLRIDNKNLMALTLVFFIFITGLVSVSTRSLTRGLTEIARESSGITRTGNTNAAAFPSSSIKEVDMISTSIMSMLATIDEKVRHATITAEELQLFIENANALIFGTDLEGRVNEWNRLAEDLTGFKKEDIIGKDFLGEVLGKGYTNEAEQVFNNALKGQSKSNFELILKSSTGESMIILTNINSRRDLDANITGLLVVGQDITELDRFRNQMQEIVAERTIELNTSLDDTELARERIDGILKSIGDGLIVTDIHGRIEMMNRSAEEVLNVRLSELIDRPIRNAIDSAELESSVVKMLQSKAINGLKQDIKVVFPIEGKELNLRCRTSAIYDKNGMANGSITIFHVI